VSASVVSTSVSASARLSTVPDTPDEDGVLYDKDILNNPLWHNAAVRLCVDPALTHRKKDSSLQMHYQKYCAYQSAWAQIQRLNKKHQWPYPQFLKTELINLFGRRGMWNSHTVKGMQDIAQFPDMQKWLERGKDELEPTDEEVWGIAKSQYTFVDLGLWKKQGTLKDPRGLQKKKLEKEKTKGHEKERKQKRKKDDVDNEEEGSSKKGKSSGSGSKSHKRM
jgi:L-rhamnose mutarotase